MKEPGRYAGGGTAGGKCGCAAALVIGLVVCAGLMAMMFLGDCPPDASCHDGEGIRFLIVIVSTAGAAAVVGLLMRLIVQRFVDRG